MQKSKMSDLDMKSILGNIYRESEKLYRTKTKELEDKGKINHLEANLQYRMSIKNNNFGGETQRAFEDYDKEVNKKITEISRLTLGSGFSFLNDQDEEVMNKMVNDDMLLSQSSQKGSLASNKKQGQVLTKSTVKSTSIGTKKTLGLSQTKT